MPDIKSDVHRLTCISIKAIFIDIAVILLFNRFLSDTFYS